VSKRLVEIIAEVIVAPSHVFKFGTLIELEDPIGSYTHSEIAKATNASWRRRVDVLNCCRNVLGFRLNYECAQKMLA
jgi:hypothetical protein